MRRIKALTTAACVGVSLLLSSCGSFGQEFWQIMADGMTGTYSSLAQPTTNAYQSTTASSGTTVRKADNKGGVYVGDKYVNLNAYGVTREGMFINSVNSGSLGSGYSDTYTSPSTSSTSSSRSTTSSSSSSRQCTICNGTGKVKRSASVGTYGVDTSKKKCPTCGEMMMGGNIHSHLTCINCKGTGVVK